MKRKKLTCFCFKTISKWISWNFVEYERQINEIDLILYLSFFATSSLFHCWCHSVPFYLSLFYLCHSLSIYVCIYDSVKVQCFDKCIEFRNKSIQRIRFAVSEKKIEVETKRRTKTKKRDEKAMAKKNLQRKMLKWSETKRNNITNEMEHSLWQYRVEMSLRVVEACDIHLMKQMATKIEIMLAKKAHSIDIPHRKSLCDRYIYYV